MPSPVSLTAAPTPSSPATARAASARQACYALADTRFGRLVVAGTTDGISAVSLADDDEALLRSLRRELPRTELVRDDAGALAEWTETIVRHLRGAHPELDLPLDVEGTAFQWRVWRALCAIPYGHTRSYSEVARALGQPTAARAVAHACATNPVPLIVPCHRVVREDGSLGGYGLGLHRKRALLDLERSVADAG